MVGSPIFMRLRMRPLATVIVAIGAPSRGRGLVM